MTVTPTETSTDLVRATSVKLRRAEGPTHSCSTTFTTFDGDTPWEQSRARLREWAFSAPTDGTVDKVDFTITYPDGQTYTGCFGLTGTDTDIAAHVRFMLGRTIENRSGFEDPCDIRDAREFLDRYALSD